jgi:hypothetical protein
LVLGIKGEIRRMYENIKNRIKRFIGIGEEEKGKGKRKK